VIVGGGPNVWAEPSAANHPASIIRHTNWQTLRNKHYLNESFMETYHLKWMREKKIEKRNSDVDLKLNR
jgi:hypothetical protein